MKNEKDFWYRDKVVSGGGGGKTIGFPTVNLDPTPFIKRLKEGVYSSKVKYLDKIYLGALYFGPRLINKETKSILEIYILDFDKQIYGERLEFKIGRYIRKVKELKSLQSLKNQIKKDVEKIKTLN